MRILDRYLFDELRPPFFIGFFIFTFVLLMNQIFHVLELAIGRGVGIRDAGMLLLYSVPATVSVTIPMALLLAVLMSFGRLSKDNEITALQASGISFYRIIASLVLLGLFCSVAMIFFNDIVLPYGNYAYKKLYVDIIRKKAEVVIRPGQFIHDFDDFILYVDKLDPASGQLEGILIFQTVAGAPLRTITAKRGALVGNPDIGLVALELYDGQMQSVDMADPAVFMQASFSSHSLYLDIDNILRSSRTVRKSAREMTIREISTYVKKHRDRGLLIRSYLVEFHKKLSIPFACLAFILIGAPLGIQARRSGKGAGLGISIILIFIYYVLIISGQILGGNGTLSPFIAMWLPNFIIGGTGLFLIYLVGQQPEIRWLRLPGKMIERFRGLAG